MNWKLTVRRDPHFPEVLEFHLNNVILERVPVMVAQAGNASLIVIAAIRRMHPSLDDLKVAGALWLEATKSAEWDGLIYKPRWRQHT